MSERYAVALYIDYKSPYAFLAKDPAWGLEADFPVRIDWRPYTLRIPDYLGTVETRNAHQWRRVRYSYMDARRLANERGGIVVRGPRRIFDSTVAHVGMFFAQDAGTFRAYNDLVFERFWKRELDIEDVAAVAGVIAESGADPLGFEAFLAGEGRARYERTIDEAEAAGVFGVPMFVVDGELFWGQDRIPQVRRRLSALLDAPDPRS